MDCRQFRNKHVAFVDDLLSAVDMDAMDRHRARCPRCARQDAAVRRSLMLVRNLPTIEPSADFMVRLNSRIEKLGPAGRVDVIAPRPHYASVATFAALAAGLVAVGYIALQADNYFTEQQAPRPAAMVATLPVAATPMSDAMLVASVPTAMPVWPAVLMAGQTPMQFASMEFTESERTR